MAMLKEWTRGAAVRGILLKGLGTSGNVACKDILSDMAAAIETKLTKARQIKQGMMQELLTERIRLV